MLHTAMAISVVLQMVFYFILRLKYLAVYLYAHNIYECPHERLQLRKGALLPRELKNIQ